MKNKQVIVHLYGGIGNQLFQYTFGEYVKNKYKMDVLYDISSFGVLATFRDLQIESIVNDIPIYETNKYFFSRHTRFYRRISRWIFRHKPGVKYFDNKIDENIFCKKNWNLLYLDGYWHNKIYAEWVMNNLGNIYKPLGKLPECLEKYISYINSHEVVSVHIRRGDYLNAVNASRFGSCTKVYYQRAIEEIQKKINNPYFLFFSDDTDWVKENFQSLENMMIVENDDIPPFWYIHLMSLCAHNIMSNSTFSWWGSFLNSNENKLVVSPQRWYLDEKNPKFYFKNWILF
ncbi:MAG: alpha-1,2-fucosyltransferase [Bacteroidales bacterium]|nr:alpha-1,2-fucosyltransferase [Bacteroidales bacterium]